MQIVENKFLGEFYAYCKNKKYTLSVDRGVWTCSCYESDCEHVAAVKQWIKSGGDNKWAR